MRKRSKIVCLLFYWGTLNALVNNCSIHKPGLNESQLPLEGSVTLVSSIVVERRRCALQASSLEYKRIKKRDAPLNWQ